MRASRVWCNAFVDTPDVVVRVKTDSVARVDEVASICSMRTSISMSVHRTAPMPVRSCVVWVY